MRSKMNKMMWVFQTGGQYYRVANWISTPPGYSKEREVLRAHVVWNNGGSSTDVMSTGSDKFLLVPVETKVQ